MFTWLTGLIAGPIVNGLIAGYRAKLEAENTTDRYAADLAAKDIEAEIERRKAQRDLGIASMSHPVWWVAWALFVLPVGLYHAAIFTLSTLSIPPCSPDLVEGCYSVLRVPAAQEQLSVAVIQYLFLAQGLSGIAGAAMRRFGR